MRTKVFLASMAVASLAIAQPVVAATRSADSLPTSGVRTAEGADRVGALTDESEEFRGRPVVAVVLIAALLAALILALSNSKSPG